MPENLTFEHAAAVPVAGQTALQALRSRVELVRSLGAERVIDYTRAEITDDGRRHDLVLDIAGKRPLRELRDALTRDGTLVFVGGEDGDRWTGGLDFLRRLLETGQVTPVISSTVKLRDVPDAIRDLLAGRVQGKVVITP